MCDFCYESFNIGVKNLSHEKVAEFEMHLKLVDNYKDYKKSILSRDNLLNYLILEVDFCQNKSLPKLNVSSNYFKRKFWFYLFNLHNH